MPFLRVWLNDALKRMDRVFTRMYESDAKRRSAKHRTGETGSCAAVASAVFDSKRTHADGTISYNALFRWFVGLAMDDAVWGQSMFSKNRDRLLAHDVIVNLFNETVETVHARGHLSGEHFSVDGTLIQAWAGQKSFVRKNKSDDDAPPDGGARPRENWHGEKRSNETHESSTDDQEKLFRKSRRTGALLCYIGHLLTDKTGMVWW